MRADKLWEYHASRERISHCVVESADSSQSWQLDKWNPFMPSCNHVPVIIIQREYVVDL